MKNIAAILMVAATMSVASATSIDIYWQEDRENVFALTILGTGLNVGVTTVSPSGQWSLWSGYMGRYDANWGSPVIRWVTGHDDLDGNSGEATPGNDRLRGLEFQP